LTQHTILNNLVDVVEKLFLGGVVVGFKLVVYVEEDVGSYQSAYSL
jgi:hypothetical protein